VSILHSKLSIYDKYSSWKKILNGEVQIVIGARSAIFAPLNNLGIIIIDEEHEATYIQENNPRYDALELAKLRSKTHQCPLVLGSATPKVTDYYKAILGEYELLSLPKRINQRPLPSKSVIDMTLELKNGNKSVFSEKLKKALINTYQKKEQAILFLNRRGHSSFVMCRNCGEVIKCPHCDVSLTYHSASNLLKCHYCGFSKPNVSSCPACGSGKIRFVGSGTEKVTEEISRLLPEARVLRVDMDTVSKMSDYDTIFSQFKNQEADILVGTQMIAKGLDFENVTLVGLVNADIALHYPSYDAHAVAYNLIEQVSGRAGRGSKPGEVIIQTYQPKHFVIQSSVKNDFEHFFNQEINARKIAKMPPFSEAI
ncbi:MAG: primosomal protein N', partial [Anaeroplasmataceae bacterium]|nr:primosomal protein N' [Anaeroplasmataceae bacterium]